MQTLVSRQKPYSTITRIKTVTKKSLRFMPRGQKQYSTITRIKTQREFAYDSSTHLVAFAISELTEEELFKPNE
jgi:hypothetical protein